MTIETNLSNLFAKNLTWKLVPGLFVFAKNKHDLYWKMKFWTELLDWWLKGDRCDISAESMSIGFSRPKFNVNFKNHGSPGWLGGISEICFHLLTSFFVKQHVGRIIKETAYCLLNIMNPLKLLSECSNSIKC